MPIAHEGEGRENRKGGDEMSILIEGMKLPKSCDNCDLIQFDDEGLEAHCPLSPYYRWCGTPPDYIPEGCPLVEIPTPHGRLIDADKLNKKLERHRDMCGDIETQYGIDMAIRILNNTIATIKAEASE